MLPKLTAFYFSAVLPELASPRNNTISGIREPGIWVSLIMTGPVLYYPKLNLNLR